MPNYVLTGKLGGGKSLAAVGRIREYLRQGRRIATNLDLYPEKILPRDSRQTVTRLPDKPRLQDLELLGTGDGAPIEEYNEEHFGLLVLDELGSWFNSRNWNDKERAGLIEWFLHARKYHWDVILIVQSEEMIDKQLRQSLCEHLVIARRMDRIAVPVVGRLVKLLTGKRVTLPKMHVASVYYGENTQALRVDRWWYRGADLYPAYRTGQVFRMDVQIHHGEAVDMRAPYTVLSPWHLVGRYYQRPTWQDIANRVFALPGRVILWLGCHVVAMVRGRSPRAIAMEWGVLKHD